MRVVTRDRILLIMALPLVASLVLVKKVCAVTPHNMRSEFNFSADGRAYEINVDGSSEVLSDIALYFESVGSVSTAVEMAIQAPPGVVGTIHTKLALNSEPSTIQVPRPGKGMSANQFTIEAVKGYDVVTVLYHIHKDACLSDVSTRYKSRVVLSFAAIEPSAREHGFKIIIAAKEHRFAGSMAASIKPVAEGQFRGEPILLMSSIQYGGEFVRVINRRRGRVYSHRIVPVLKYVFYRGYTLSLTRLRGVLRSASGGGRATFEITNGGYVYGVCFDLVRKRQVVNGYPFGAML